MTAHDPALVERMMEVLEETDFDWSAQGGYEGRARAVLDAITTSHAIVETADSIRKRCNCGNESDLSWCDDDCGRFTAESGSTTPESEE